MIDLTKTPRVDWNLDQTAQFVELQVKIIQPPQEIKSLVDKAAQFVAKHSFGVWKEDYS